MTSEHPEPMSDPRAELLDRFERATELPLVLLAVLMIPLLLAPVVIDLSEGWEQAIYTIDWFIWAAFAFEFAVRFSLTRQRWRFLRRNWPDVLIVVLPFLRPLRIVRSARALRLLRLARLAAIVGVIEHDGRRLLLRHKLHYAIVAAGVVVSIAALVVHAVESGEGGAIATRGDAFWWAIATVTTVGYGDVVPATAMGRGVATFLMLMGIALFGVVTANLAAFFVESDGRPGEAEAQLANEMAELRLELRAVREQLRAIAGDS